jgi:hypothetical protein
VGVTFYANNGKTLDMNHPAKQLLEKMTMCWWNKLGIPSKISKEDTLMMARILKNFIKLQKITYYSNDDEGLQWRIYGFVQEDVENIGWWKLVYKFFKESGGIKKRA